VSESGTSARRVPEASDDGERVTFTRPEYGRLAEEFRLLARAFGHDLAPRIVGDVARLTSAIERIDRWVDEACLAAVRRERWRGVIAILSEEPGVPRLPAELADAAHDLRRLGRERHGRARIRRIVRDEAKTSERIRGARSAAVYVRAVEREGRLTAALALIVAGASCGPSFRRFFFRLAAPANLVDKILDAKEDHARGEIALRPGVRLYGALLWALLRRVVMLLATTPRFVLVLGLARRYLFPSIAR
jgi:hypothetical protein